MLSSKPPTSVFSNSNPFQSKFDNLHTDLNVIIDVCKHLTCQLKEIDRILAEAKESQESVKQDVYVVEIPATMNTEAFLKVLETFK